MNTDLLISLGVSFALASVTTILLLIVTPPLAWWLARTTRRGRALVEALVALPLVLPPTVLGFYLLLAMAADGPLGRLWLALTDSPLAFTFSGLVIGSVLYSLPFVSQPLAASFRNTPTTLLDAAAVLGASPRQRFWQLIGPAKSHRHNDINGSLCDFSYCLEG